MPRKSRKIDLLAILVAVSLVASACGKKPRPIVEANTPAPAPAAPKNSDVAARVDLSDVTLGHVRAHLSKRPVTPESVAESVVAAIVDVLVLRELAVLDIRPRTDEPKPEAVRRLLNQVYSPHTHCGGVSQRDLKLAYMTQLARFKHPASWTLWTALTPVEDDAKRLVAALSTALPPPPDLPSETTCTGPDGPVAKSHAVPFEQVVASLPNPATPIQLRRYTFYDQQDPKIAPGHFRGTDPNVAAAVSGLKIGALTGPIRGATAWHVVLVVCRDKRRFSALSDPTVQAELRVQMCQGAADLARKEHIERLLKGATDRKSVV